MSLQPLAPLNSPPVNSRPTRSEVEPVGSSQRKGRAAARYQTGEGAGAGVNSSSIEADPNLERERDRENDESDGNRVSYEQGDDSDNDGDGDGDRLGQRTIDMKSLAALVADVDSRAHEARVLQQMGSNFFASLSIKPEDLSSGVKDPLMLAASLGDTIDVQMLLEEVGAREAPAAVLRPDDSGRTPLHLAALSGSPVVLKHLISSYRELSSDQLDLTLERLEEERQDSIAEVRGTSRYKGPGRDPRISAVDEWFKGAVARAHRLDQFRLELWWAKCLSSRDTSGRTPLHYAVLGRKPSALVTLLTTGFGQYSMGNTKISYEIYVVEIKLSCLLLTTFLWLVVPSLLNYFNFFNIV